MRLECVHARVILDWDGAAVRHGPNAGSANRRSAGGGAPAGPDAPALARGACRPGAPARRGLGAARGDRDRRAALGDPLRAAGLREDHPGADHRHRVPRGLRGGLGGQRRAGRGPGRDRAGRGAPQGRGRADDLLPRRDPSLQQGPAGRAAARGRGGAGDADRGDDREPLLRGQLGAALTRRSSTSCAPLEPSHIRQPAGPRARRPRTGDRRAPDGRSRGAGAARRALGRRRAGGALRARARGGDRAGREPSGRPRRPPRTRCSARRSATTARAIATTTTSRPGSRRPAPPTPTHRSTTWR